MTEHEKKRRELIKVARRIYTRDGEVEIDDNAKISEGDSGAYVQAWVWVDYEDLEE